MSTRRFRIAFSYAGEKRDFVEKVAAIVAKQFGEEAILYDKYHEAEFARYDLGILLPKFYTEQADLIVPVLCPAYDTKRWTGVEWVHIHGLLTKEDGHRVMPCRFEHATVDGLSHASAFVDLDDKTPEQAAVLILERLARNEGHPRDHYTKHLAADSKPSSSSTPNNLPRLQYFFGRTDELKKIAGALAPEARTWGALIDGPGGIGKTSLAVRAAELVPYGQFNRIIFLSAKERELSADGQRRLTGFVLPGYLEMLNEIARLLEKPELTKQPDSERARLILEALVPERALLILDNLESLVPEQRELLFTLLSRLSQGSKAIVTSRRRTDVEARIIRLGKLEQSAALDYLVELGEGRPLLARASETERLHLYEETGGNPLLLRWIAGQLGKGRCRTIAGALEFLRGAPPDNDPLEFIFGDLLETFTKNETIVLAALTHFTRAIKVKFIAELGGISATAAETALGDLANRALIVPDDEDKTFALVPMVAVFLRRKRPEVVAETGNRLEKRAYALIVENGYDQYDRFPLLEADWPNLAAALPLFLAGPNDRLQTVCNALELFLEFTGRWDDRISLEQRAEARAVAAGDHNNAGWRAYQAGWIHYLRGQADAVLVCADQADSYWKIAKAGAGERYRVIRLRGLGHRLKEDYPSAIASFRQALKLCWSLSAESADVACALNDLACVERVSGDFDAAELNYREGLRVAHVINGADGVATFTGQLAELALARKDWPGAETLAREALPLSEKLGRQILIACNCDRIAKALVRQEKASEALPYARRAVDIYTRLGFCDLEDARATLEECER